MAQFAGRNNETHPGRIAREACIQWSRKRAWPGEEVKVFVRTLAIDDNTNVKYIVSDSGGEHEVDTVDGKSVAASKLDDNYKLDWKGKPFGVHKEFILKGPVGDHLKPLSDVLFVDLSKPVFSA